MTTATRSIAFGRTTIPYRIRVSQRRTTIGITVKPDATVLATIPPRTRRAVVDSAVASRAHWIQEQWEKLRRMDAHLPREFCSGESFRYLGRSYRLRVIAAGTDEPTLRLTAGCFVASVDRIRSNGQSAPELRALFESWYRARANSYLPGVVSDFAKRIGAPSPHTRIVLMRTRWGSCSDGRIRLSWNIMMAPRRLVRYVAAHEVCHLIHAHHSPSFWRLLERLLPDCRRRHAELAVLGPRLAL